MKIRIISGILMALITIGFIMAGLFVNPLFICAFVMIVSAIAAFELTKNVAGIKSKAVNAGAAVFSAIVVYLLLGFRRTAVMLGQKSLYYKRDILLAGVVCIYALCMVVFTLIKHKEMDLAKILTGICAVPFLAFVFVFMGGIINVKNGVYYILLLFVFSSGCDMGAYFTGVTIGKHKLCPELSPKKTVEGSIGGIVTTIILTLVVVFIFKNHIDINTAKIVATVLLSVPLCIIGMMGDLFASAIKRSVGIKDYGNLIPGHGGILDRFDSILMISPVLYGLIRLGVI